MSSLLVPIEKLLHDDKFAYAQEGHGGKDVWHWPIYHFFKLYADGKIPEAEKAFIGWYKDQYQKYGQLEKAKGGMKGGSLARLIMSMKESGVANCFEEAVALRVRQRFELLESISNKGYIPNFDSPITAIRRKRHYILFGGHHRVAVLAALGYTHIPDILVFKNNLHYRLYVLYKKASNKIRSIKKVL